MEDLKKALEVREKYNKMNTDEFIKMCEEYAGEKIPDDVQEFWGFTGLLNTDFFKMYVMGDQLITAIETSKHQRE